MANGGVSGGVSSLSKLTYLPRLIRWTSLLETGGAQLTPLGWRDGDESLELV